MCKIALFILIAFGYKSATACTCSYRGYRVSLKEELNSADVILSGTIISSVIVSEEDAIAEGIYKDSVDEGSQKMYVQISKNKLLVERVYKGIIKRDTIIVLTGLGGGDCGYWFGVGSKYTVFGNLKESFPVEGAKAMEEAEVIWTNICDHTHEYSKSYADYIEYWQSTFSKQPLH